jgi:3-(3-hydroxy-phenyl)propionate hydroxylase
LLDAAIGSNFAAIGDPALLAAVDAGTRAHWAALGLVVLPASGRALLDWLDQHEVAAVLLRPDRYVAGVARNAADLAAITRALPGRSAPPQ